MTTAAPAEPAAPRVVPGALPARDGPGSADPAATVLDAAPAPPSPAADRLVGVLSRAGIFHGVDEPALQVPLRALKPVGFLRGDVIFSEGEPGDHLYILGRGKVKIARRTPQGRETLLMVAGPSDMFGVLSMFDPGPRTATATAVTAGAAYTMDRDTLRRWIAERPEIAGQLLRVLARRLRRTDNALCDMIFTDVGGRVAKVVLGLAHQFGTRERDLIRVSHDLTQREIAQLVGASRETVNKALADFADRGWIRLENRSVTILQHERLVRRAG